MKKLVISVVLVLTLAGVCEASRYQMVSHQGKEVVVHTRRAPVVVHRVLPPYGLGKHIYKARLHRGN